MGPVSWQFIGKRSSDSYDGSEIEAILFFCEKKGWPILRTLSRDSYCLLYTSYSLLTVCPGFLIITVKPRKKMEEICISWSGDHHAIDTVSGVASDLIRELCSEYRGTIRARVLIQKAFFEGKVPFTFEDQLYLAVFESNYVIVIHLEYLDIRELIFMYDNKKVMHTELPVNISVIFEN